MVTCRVSTLICVLFICLGIPFTILGIILPPKKVARLSLFLFILNSASEQKRKEEFAIAKQKERAGSVNCIHRESNPSHLLAAVLLLGRQISYRWTIDADGKLLK
jgi:hypothetical protein